MKAVLIIVLLRYAFVLNVRATLYLSAQFFLFVQVILDWHRYSSLIG